MDLQPAVKKDVGNEMHRKKIFLDYDKFHNVMACQLSQMGCGFQ